MKTENKLSLIQNLIFKDYSHGQNSVLYTDDRILFLSAEAPSYPYTVVAEYTVNTGNTHILFPNFIPFYSYKTSLEKAGISIKKYFRD